MTASPAPTVVNTVVEVPVLVRSVTVPELVRLKTVTRIPFGTLSVFRSTVEVWALVRLRPTGVVASAAWGLDLDQAVWEAVPLP